MTEYGDGRTECAAMADQLAEFALGALPGRERQSVLAHLETCEHCRAEVEQLALTADSILQAAPRIEPPLGFEQRLADRMHGSATERRVPFRQRFRAVWALAASVVVLSLGIGVGLAAAPGSSPSAAPPTGRPHATQTAALTSGGQVYGHVTTFVGHGPQPAWLAMTMRRAEWSGPVTCQITVRNGSVITLGSFWLHEGSGYWDAPLPVAANQVTGARVTAADGKVVATAALHA